MQQLLCYVGLAKHLPDTGERSRECVKEEISFKFDTPSLSADTWTKVTKTISGNWKYYWK